MKRLDFAIFSFFLSAAAAAQEPMARVSLATNETIWVGQKCTLIVELLAPGFFSSAPSFDLPDPPGLLLMPPAGRPVLSTEETNGISYTVQLHELAVFSQRGGEQVIPSFKTRFAYKSAPLDTNEVKAAVETTPVRFTVTSPPGTEKLGTILSALDLKATEEWKPDPEKTNVVAGAAFTRTITFAAPDIPAMAFPPFPMVKIEGISIYPKPPEVLDQSERGSLRGERRDVITYVCKQPGQFTIPAVRLIWWDLEVKKLRTNDFPARVITVAPNPALAQAAVSSPTHKRQLGWGWIIPALVAVLLPLIVVRRFSSLKAVLTCLFAPFRPIHLEPLNPVSHSRKGSSA